MQSLMVVHTLLVVGSVGMPPQDLQYHFSGAIIIANIRPAVAVLLPVIK